MKSGGRLLNKGTQAKGATSCGNACMTSTADDAKKTPKLDAYVCWLVFGFLNKNSLKRP
jgi:hypothetical protein